jgi:hypothetical protein
MPPRKSPFDKGEPAKAAKEDEPDAGGDEGGGEDAGRAQPSLQLDSGEAMGFVKFFHSLESPPERTIRFFHRKKEGEFYSVHGDDAIYIAQECFHTMSVVKYLGKNNELPAVTVSTANFNSFAAQLLTERQYRIEVWGENKVGRPRAATLPLFAATSWAEPCSAQDRACAVRVQRPFPCARVLTCCGPLCRARTPGASSGRARPVTLKASRTSSLTLAARRRTLRWLAACRFRRAMRDGR